MAVVKIFWPVRNNQNIIDTINKSNSTEKAISTSAFDFSDLYTNIPHRNLKSVVGELLNFCFNGGNKELIGFIRYDAVWTNDQ